MKTCEYVHIAINKIIFCNQEEIELTVTGDNDKYRASDERTCNYRLKGIFSDYILIDFLETVKCNRVYISENDFSYLNNRAQYLMKDSVVMF